MYNRRIVGAASAAAAAAAALGNLTLAHAQTGPQGQGQQAGAAAFGSLISAIIQNVQALANVNVANSLNNLLQNALQNADIRVLNLNNVLNGAQVNALSDILNNSQVLSNITVDVQNVLNNNDVLKNFLNNNNVALDRVVAVDVLSAPVTLYIFNPR